MRIRLSLLSQTEPGMAKAKTEQACNPATIYSGPRKACAHRGGQSALPVYSKLITPFITAADVSRLAGLYVCLLSTVCP